MTENFHVRMTTARRKVLPSFAYQLCDEDLRKEKVFDAGHDNGR
jgi:hypothetical protein